MATPERRRSIITSHKVRRGLTARLLFTAHATLCVYQVAYFVDDSNLWSIMFLLGAMYVEFVFVACHRRGKEWKWFFVCIFCYLMVVIPALWILELDILENRLALRETDDDDCGLKESEKIVSNTNRTIDFIQILGLAGTGENWSLILQQLLVFVLIIGRWILPRGNITGDQLSQLLLVYIGSGADILEFAAEGLRLNEIRCNTTIIYATLFIWTVSILQFTLPLTATAQHPSHIVTPRLDSIRRVVAKCCGTESWAIVISILVQDGPFLIVRLYLFLYKKVINELLLFFACKNVLTIILQGNRLYTLLSKKRGLRRSTIRFPFSHRLRGRSRQYEIENAKLQPEPGTYTLGSDDRVSGADNLQGADNVAYESDIEGSWLEIEPQVLQLGPGNVFVLEDEILGPDDRISGADNLQGAENVANESDIEQGSRLEIEPQELQPEPGNIPASEDEIQGPDDRISGADNLQGAENVAYQSDIGSSRLEIEPQKVQPEPGNVSASEDEIQGPDDRISETDNLKGEENVPYESDIEGSRSEIEPQKVQSEPGNVSASEDEMQGPDDRISGSDNLQGAEKVAYESDIASSRLEIEAQKVQPEPGNVSASEDEIQGPDDRISGADNVPYESDIEGSRSEIEPQKVQPEPGNVSASEDEIQGPDDRISGSDNLQGAENVPYESDIEGSRSEIEPQKVQPEPGNVPALEDKIQGPVDRISGSDNLQGAENVPYESEIEGSWSEIEPQKVQPEPGNVSASEDEIQGPDDRISGSDNLQGAENVPYESDIEGSRSEMEPQKVQPEPGNVPASEDEIPGPDDRISGSDNLQGAENVAYESDIGSSRSEIEPQELQSEPGNAPASEDEIQGPDNRISGSDNLQGAENVPYESDIEGSRSEIEPQELQSEPGNVPASEDEIQGPDDRISGSDNLQGADKVAYESSDIEGGRSEIEPQEVQPELLGNKLEDAEKAGQTEDDSKNGDDEGGDN